MDKNHTGMFLFAHLGRAGHGTILSQQRKQIFRPQSCYLSQYYCISLASPSRHRDLNICPIWKIKSTSSIPGKTGIDGGHGVLE